MGEFTVTAKDGSEWEVTAGSPEEAAKLQAEHQKAETTAKTQADWEAQSPWTKPFTAVDDMARIGGNAATLGMLDRMLGPEAEAATEAARVRSGIAGTAAEIGGSMALPTGVPGAIAKVGGGPIVRGVTGLLAGGASGGAYGGAEAAIKGEPVVSGVLGGAASGAGGQLIGEAARAVVRPIAKKLSGVVDTLPPPTTANVPGKAPNPARRVESAAYKAEKAGGTPANIISQLKTMNQNRLPADVLGDIRNITHGDLGTKAANLVSKAGYSAGGAAPFTGFHSIPLALAQGVAGPAVGATAKFAAGQGATEGLEQLRRKLLKIPKFEGPISREMVEKLSRGSRGGIKSLLDEE
jgi:hypothetical protein